MADTNLVNSDLIITEIDSNNTNHFSKNSTTSEFLISDLNELKNSAGLTGENDFNLANLVVAPESSAIPLDDLKVVASRKRKEKKTLQRLDLKITNFLLLMLKKYLHYLVISFAVIYLFYSWYSIQTKYAQTQANNFDGIVSLTQADTIVKFYRDAGTNRPLLTTKTGDFLVEYTDWASSITVNGDKKNLWDTYHDYNVDLQTNKLYRSMVFGSWTLFQEVSFGPEPNHVLIEYYFRDYQDPAEVILQLGHYRYYYQSPQIGPYGFEAILSGGQNTAPEEQANSQRYNLSLLVNLSAFKKGEVPVKVEEGARNKFGVISITTTYTYPKIPVNERTLVASEEVYWKNLGSN